MGVKYLVVWLSFSLCYSGQYSAMLSLSLNVNQSGKELLYRMNSERIVSNVARSWSSILFRHFCCDYFNRYCPMTSRKAPSMAEAFQSASKRQRGLTSPSSAAPPAPAPQPAVQPTAGASNTPLRQPSVTGIAASESFSFLPTPATRKIKMANNNNNAESTFNDPIHGNITMDGLCLKIIDTKEFQRLRRLMQLGTCSYVYYGATHSRFEHSIGVSHFAGLVAKNLQTAQPDLGITEEDILCVKVAGLCHDLGHGPFSHVFDGVFMPRVDPKTTWRHEDGSVQMLKFLLKNNNIDKDDNLLRKYNLTAKDVTFIEEIISGTKEKHRKGRGPEKFYLYDIVNNSRSGLDVDKLDYFMRDMRYTNASSSSTCNFQRIVEMGRVYAADPIGAKPAAAATEDPAQKHFMICYPEKMVTEALDVFAMRFKLHQKIYTHKSVKKVEFMITDALVAANEVIRIPGQRTVSHPDGRYKMSECVYDPEALSNLHDQVITLIELSDDPRLKQSQKLLKMVQNRRFYPTVGKTSYDRTSKLFRQTDEQIEDEIIRCSVELRDEYLLTHPASSLPTTQMCSPQKISRVTAVNRVGGSMLSTAAAGSNGMEVDMFSAIALSPDDSRFIQSQDSLAGDYYMDTDNEVSRDGPPMTGNGSSAAAATIKVPVVLVKGDIIIDKMHIHFGKKSENPVQNMRFYPKGADPAKYIAKAIDEKVYETSLPRSFEELAVRVFCRDPSKQRSAEKAFEKFCVEVNTHRPFPSQSQVGDINIDFDAEGEDESDVDS